MLQFNELRITPDGKHLIVDVQVQELDYYKNIYIDSICFDVHSSYSATGPSSNAVEIFKANEGDTQKHIRILWDIDLLKDKLFFVFAITKGAPEANTPCGMKDTAIMGITYNQYPIYTIAIKSLKEIDSCSPAQSFINFSLRLKAFELCLKTGDYIKAIKYWDKFFVKDKQVLISKCMCNE